MKYPQKSLNYTKEEGLENMAKMGRPTIYTQEMAERICDAVSKNDVGLDALHKRFDWFPDSTTIYSWTFRNKDFALMYREAVKHRTDMRAMNMLEESTNYADEDYYIDALGNRRLDPAKVAAKKIKLDNDKWVSVKLLPRTYGDKLETTHKLDKVEDWLDVIKDPKD